MLSAVDILYPLELFINFVILFRQFSSFRHVILVAYPFQNRKCPFHFSTQLCMRGFQSVVKEEILFIPVISFFSFAIILLSLIGGCVNFIYFPLLSSDFIYCSFCMNMKHLYFNLKEKLYSNVFENLILHIPLIFFTSINNLSTN